MNLCDFLQDLVIKGWKFWHEDNRLRYLAPKEESTPSILAELKQHKAEIIQLFQEQPNIFNIYPLSYGQRALWFLWQLAPESYAYNVSFATRICSVIDMTVMSKALEALVERHPVLRTTFSNRGSEPIQQVHQNQVLDFLQIDGSSWSEDELKTKVIDAHQICFDLEGGSVIRVRLFSCSDCEHVLLLSIHHIVCDRWSLEILAQELLKFYQAQRSGIEISLPPLKHSYQDYVNWQKKILSGTEGEKLWSYWQHQLAGDLPALNLPTDKLRSPIQTYNGASHKFKLSSQLTGQLKELAQSLGVTFYVILLAAFKVLLYRYTGQDDILVGSPTSGRSQPQFAPIVGYFVDPVVIRTDLSNNLSFKEFLPQVRQTVLEALTHQDYPFALLVEKLQPYRDPSRSPIFQASFALQQLRQSQGILLLLEDETQKDIEWGGLKLRPFNLRQQEGLFDLDLEIVEGRSSAIGVFKYNTDLFDGQTIERMSGHFQNLLTAIVSNPLLKVGEIPLLTEAERHQLLWEWNDTKCESTTDKCIHQLFEAQVEKTPLSVALVCEEEQLTYSELNTRANKIAHELQSQGVGANVLVGLCVERSPLMIVGLLAILKAGGTYLPLDRAYPSERLLWMMEDAQVSVLLTQQKLLPLLAQQSAAIICLDKPTDLRAQNHCNPTSLVTLDDLAYVIYTSGSTGTPKGVPITHHSLATHCQELQKYFGIDSTDRVLQFSSLNFDPSLEQIFTTLIAGATLCVRGAELWTPAELTAKLLTQKLSVINLPPAYWQQVTQHWANEPEVISNHQLKLMIVGGEKMPIQALRWWERSPLKNVRLLNVYGPTEATIIATSFEIPQGFLQDNIPIGRPLANRKVYILDSNGHPVPIGVSGELHLGGVGLSPGYLNQPEMTREKFIADPFSDKPDSRLYKTGDLARYRRDGLIEYLGRLDSQVKIRGFRIELGEIEAVLNTHPQIQLAVVIANEDIPGNTRLVAYVVSSDQSLTSKQLREFLQGKLPEYMVPSSFVTLDTLPLTPNGKIDTKALPIADRIASKNEYVPPSTAIEETLTNIWQQILLTEKVSIHDNFFEIGGDSILSIQVVSRAKNAGIQITPKQIFLYQTIAELALVANKTVSAECKQGIVTGVAPLTPIQHWFFAQKKLVAHHYNQSVLLEIPKNLESEFIEIALKKLLEHHDALRLRFTKVGDEYKQINESLDNKVPLTVVDLSSTPKREQAQTLEKIATEYQASLNLLSGPIMQVVMFNLGNKESRLLIIIHHLAVDGVSWRILVSDLETIYQQLIAGKTPKLEAKTTAFIDWAEKLNNYAQSQILKNELDYWLNQPWSHAAALPLDYENIQQENIVENAASVSVKLSQQETRTLLGKVNEAYNTQINDILLSALVQVLFKWTRNPKVLIDLEGHGREELFDEVDLSRTIGWFTSIFPVLLEVPTINQLASVIKSIKEQLREIPHRGIGYGMLRYLCNQSSVKEQLQKIKSAEIGFNYLGQFDQIQSETAWKLAAESSGVSQSLKQTRDHLLDINALVIEGELQIEWTYSVQVHSQRTVENLANSYIQEIRSIIEYCQSQENRGYTPSDFPLAKLSQEEIDELLVAPLKTQKIESIYPLSPMQQGMLFHSLYAPESGVYFEQMTLSLKGDINVEAFESAWKKVVDRHSVLRTLFVWENRKTPLQVVLNQVDLPWNNLEWQKLSSTEQQQQFSELLQKQRRLGFQFDQAPLMRCTLIQLSDDTYKFIWSHHHILMDGWCLPIIFKEVLSFYKAELTGESDGLPTPPLYRDYIAWLNSQDKQAAAEFWRETLHGFQAPTPLVVDKKTIPNQQLNSDYFEIELRLSSEVTQKLQAVAPEHHVTLSTIVQAAWGILLSHYSGEDDVVFGVTVSGRSGSLSGVENMVGLLINTLPLRVQISNSEQLILTLEKIQQLMSESQHYSDTPLVEIQAVSKVAQGIPLFESIVVFENYPVDNSLFTESSSLQLSGIEGFEQTNYPLTLIAVPGNELLVKISYDTVRFEEDTIERMLGHLQTIFSAIVSNPLLKVGEIPLLTEAERHQLLWEWNDTKCESTTDKCIHQLFEAQVEKTPLSVALVCEEEQLTYSELNTRANKIAHELQSQGVGANVLVGLCVERSPLMIVGLLAILKAGGTYLPLDRAYPSERLLWMMEDAQVSVLLTQQKLLPLLAQQSAAIICLDKPTDLRAQNHCNPTSLVTLDDLAYVIYTSGSTGTPKGVPITHHSLATHCQEIQKYFGIDSTDRVLQFSSLNFDPSLEQIFTTLIAGATLCVRGAELWTPAELTAKLLTQKLSVINLPPAYWQQVTQHWANEPEVISNHQLKLMIVGGEKMPIQALRWWERSPLKNVRLLNVYGPTEATIIATSFEIPQGFLQDNIPIGRPLANRKVYILDSNGHPVPIGVSGELHLGGVGLSPGYLNQPEMTREKFIADPFSDKPDSRLYKTGDLARYRRDGLIEYLGRLDSQVKIRGFRIELGEIEAVLNTHPQIQLAVVIANEDIPGNTRLVAYVVSSDQSLTSKQLREFLQGRLPEYMVPSSFVTLDTLPLTPNGKIDTKALPIADGVFREQEYITPRTPSEEIIAQIYAVVLNVQNVGIHDNFFSLGGHSLLATQLVSRLRQAFSVEIPIRAVFESPTVAQLERAITQLRSLEQGLIVPPIQPRQGDSQHLTLSFAQERLWFLDQLEGSTATYNIPAAVGVTGNLDVNALQQAFSEIVRRHSILRTSFQTVNGQPIQVIHPETTIHINLVDLQQLSVTERETVQTQLAQQQATTPFSLDTAPLIRCSVLHLSAQEYVLLLTMHHIVSDGWSMGIFISELSALYQASCATEPSPLPELPLQYADFAVWQRQWLSGLVRETQLQYWVGQLHGAPLLLQLPTDRPRSVMPTYRGKTQSFTFNSDLTQKLQKLSIESGTTLFMTLLAAFSTLLYRYSGQSDILIGSPIANRHRAEIEPLIGFFVNTLVLRTRLEDNPSFERLLAQVRETTLQAYEHQDVPFEQVVEALQPQRSLSHSPVFQVMFILQNAPVGEVTLPGITLSQLELESTVAKFDLTLSMSESFQGLVGAWEYNTDLFDGQTIERMSGHFQNLLTAIVSNPLLKVGEIPLLTEAERHQLLWEWNDTKCESTTDKCIHQLFEAQVEKTPLSVALVCEEEQLTYSELNTRANKIAHELQSQGVGANVLVGLCVERSPLMIVGLLAILKAGGTYLPLDRAYPSERLLWMMEDAQVSVLLTQQKLLPLLAQQSAAIICLDKPTDLRAQNHCNPTSLVTLDDLAYVIYTSGSTGTPKGVPITHHSLATHCQEIQKYFGIDSTDRVLQFSSLNFDPSLEQIFTTLIAGATLCVRGAELWTPAELTAKLLTQKLSVINLPPAYWQQVTQHWANEPEVISNHQLKLMIVGGEKMPIQALRWWERSPLKNVRLLNVYGPTEATIIATSFEIPQGFLQDNIPIGRPLANRKVYILDSNGHPVPIGVSGELHLGGVGLSPGYLNQPEMTREKFIADPFSDKPDSRLYKTGDLARYRRDGLIEYLGRLDSQVKIRGFRIELGEIEAVLNTHPQIQLAVVIANEDIPGNTRLVAYVVSSDQSLTSKQLREFLQGRLPEYMVPSSFVTLDTLPLTPNGKIDTKALPIADRIASENEYVPPQTPNEEIIANIFAVVLRVKNVGIHDNFFSLGGHSLLATQLVSRLRQAFSVEIPIRAVFESPTVAQLERAITQLRTLKEGLIVPPIQPRQGDSQHLTLSFAQERLWFLDQLEGSTATYNIPAAVGVTGNLDVNALQQAFSEIVRRHSILRTSFQTVNGQPIQVIHPKATIHINLVDLQQLSVTERETVQTQLAQQQATTPFRLDTAPLIRCSLLHLSAEEYVLLLTMHHIVSDGWSMGIFISELSALYQANCATEPSPLPELPLQYADFAVWQRQWLSGLVRETQLQYWVGQLHGAPLLLQLPTDRTRSVTQTYRGKTQSFTFNTDLTQKLQKLSIESGTTLFMTLLAAFSTLLYRYSGQSDILIGSPIANRHRAEIEPLIGFFVNTLVLRTRLEDNPSFERLLAQVRETTLQAYEHQDVPFEQVVEALQPQRSLSYSPVFQVMFVLQNAPVGEVTLPSLTLSPLQLESTVAKFDLTLSMSESFQGLVGAWEYNTDWFEESTIERMAGHFQNLLTAIVSNPLLRVGEIPLLTEAERHQLLWEWNDTKCESTTDKCIHQLFEAQVEKTPQAVALVFENQQLTYQQLNQTANQLAHYLQSLGVGPEVLVGICVERSVEMVVGLLGILKAGGAYVPLDPNYPLERLSYMLADSGVEVLLTQHSLRKSLPQHPAIVVCLDSDESQLTKYPDFNPITQLHPDNLAYTIYTSGSTGQPKAVQILHRAVVNFLLAMQNQPGMTADDVVVGVTSFTFDIATLEIFLPMIVGASLVMAKCEDTIDGNLLLDLLVNSGATIMQATPATWRLLLEGLWSETHQFKILCGGEALQNKLANQLLPRSTSVWNLYGPTETTIWSLISPVQSASGLVAIGRPIANTQVYILDRYLQPVPIGVPGELHLGGDGLARGYLHRPELTSEKFIPNPFGEAKSQRLYKTGDLARYLPDGNIEYLGRLDNQVKIRGFRIELAEIEAVLNTHSQIQHAVVIACEDISGDKRLVAYVVLSDNTLSSNQVRKFLGQKLPEYMVPSVFVTLDTLPLTPNGKIDRKALPVPDGVSREHEYVAPRTPVEQMLANIWANVLHLEEVGILDNFFELGGHSLTAIQAMSQLNQTFQVDLPLRHLFSTPTVAELAQTIELTRQADSTTANTVTTLDLEAEVVLDPIINLGNLIYQPVAEPSAILLTGATGFLGAFLLAELLQQTQADIYCLVRAANLTAGKQRLKENLEAYLLWEVSFDLRIIPIIGDLSQPLLGLGDEQFHLMAGKIDLIYHNGALVNHVYPYDLLKAANVRGTEAVLKLASQIKIKPVHFISTTAVFGSNEYLKVGVVQENDPLEHSQGLSGGYAQSKWVAEKLVMIARDRGLPCNTYRFSRVTWHTQTGVWNPNDLFYKFIKACMQLKSAPKMNMMIEITPIDYLTKALIKLSQQPESRGKTFHLINPDSVAWSQLIECICSLGYPLQDLCYDDWLAELLRSTQISTDNALYSFVMLADNSTSSQETPNAISNLKFDCQNTLMGLTNSSIRWPEVDDKLLQAFLSIIVEHHDKG